MKWHHIQMTIFVWGYLDLSIDIGSAMVAKIIKENCQAPHRYTCKELTQGE